MRAGFHSPIYQHALTQTYQQILLNFNFTNQNNHEKEIKRKLNNGKFFSLHKRGYSRYGRERRVGKAILLIQ